MTPEQARIIGAELHEAITPLRRVRRYAQAVGADRMDAIAEGLIAVLLCEVSELSAISGVAPVVPVDDRTPPMAFVTRDGDE